jgi:predicted nucleic acid-binding protein
VRFYFDTSVLGAVTDREDPRRIEATRKVLRAVEDGLHDGVISNVVQEELEEAPTEVQRTILRELNRIEFELVTEDWRAGTYSKIMKRLAFCRDVIEMIYVTWLSRRWRGSMLWYHGIFVIW